MSSHKFRNISSTMSPEKFEQEKKIIGILVVVGYLFIVLVISGYLFFFSQSSAKKKRSS